MPQIAGVLAVMEVTVDVWPGVVSALAIVVNHAAHVVKETKNFRAVQTNQKIMVRVKKKMIRASLVKETAVDASVDVSMEAIVPVISTVLAVTPMAKKLPWTSLLLMDQSIRMEGKNSGLVVLVVPHATECEDAAVDVDVVADIMDVVVVDRDLKEWDRKSWKEITRMAVARVNHAVVVVTVPVHSEEGGEGREAVPVPMAKVLKERWMCKG